MKNFTNTGFKDNAFDIVWALESVCHAMDKREFITEAYRILKPNGRLVLIDYFKGRDTSDKEEERDYNFFLESFACDNLDTAVEFNKKLNETGFSNVKMTDCSANFMPNTKRLELLGNLSLAFNFVLKICKIRRTEAREKGGKAALLTSRFFKNGLLTYYSFTGLKE